MRFLFKAHCTQLQKYTFLYSISTL